MKNQAPRPHTQAQELLHAPRSCPAHSISCPTQSTILPSLLSYTAAPVPLPTLTQQTCFKIKSRPSSLWNLSRLTQQDKLELPLLPEEEAQPHWLCHMHHNLFCACPSLPTPSVSRQHCPLFLATVSTQGAASIDEGGVFFDSKLSEVELHSYQDKWNSTWFYIHYRARDETISSNYKPPNAYFNYIETKVIL